MTQPKNIIICLDGTGNQIEENLSNVLKLYRIVEKTDSQLVYYDQGVGTLGQVYTWGRLRQKLRNGLGLAFGLGLDRNVIRAYEFIVRHYQEYKTDDSSKRWDNIYIFGFSRGAHTARVLAGLIYEIGILRPEQIHLCGAALTAYKQSKQRESLDQDPNDEKAYEGEGANFKRVTGARTGAVRFLGLWDTVSSVFIPNPWGFFPPITRETLPHTMLNPAVRTVRHALAIDEVRRMFRIDHWPAGQKFKPNNHSSGDPDPQDSREVWFAGSHSDVGGGYKWAESGASQFSLIWMLAEAKKSGVKFAERKAKYITGLAPWSSTTKYLYPKPDVKAKLHNSLTLWWKGMEIFPKSIRLREWPKRKSILGYYLPLGEPRFIPKDADVHESVDQRIDACPIYRPINYSKDG